MRHKAEKDYNDDGKETLNEYIFDGELGEGGFARVMKADRIVTIDGVTSTSTYALKIMNKRILKKKMISEYGDDG